MRAEGADPRPSGVRTFGSRLCFVCGQENPGGLALRFAVDGAGRAEALWRTAATSQGFAGVVHGGVVLAVLDEAMWYAAYGQGGVVMTAEAKVRYRWRVEVGSDVRACGTVVQRKGRLWECEARLEAVASGLTLAVATGRFLEAPPEDVRRLAAETQVHELPRVLQA